MGLIILVSYHHPGWVSTTHLVAIRHFTCRCLSYPAFSIIPPMCMATTIFWKTGIGVLVIFKNLRMLIALIGPSRMMVEWIFMRKTCFWSSVKFISPAPYQFLNLPTCRVAEILPACTLFGCNNPGLNWQQSCRCCWSVASGVCHDGPCKPRNALLVCSCRLLL